MLLEIAIVLVLTLVNGALAMSELAVVSARPARLRLMAEQGNGGAATALKLAEDPGKFLSSVQIGITLVGILSGAFSGATLGARLAAGLSGAGVSQGVADLAGVGIVVVLITYLSLVLGELVPKQLALRNPEALAARVAPMMALIARVAAPLVWVLDASGTAVLTVLGQADDKGDTVTEDEVRSMIADATTAGVFERDEHSMLSGVMRLADRSARGLMTPRVDVEVIDLSDGEAATREQILKARHSRLPVQDGDAESIIGVLAVRTLIEGFAAPGPLNLRDYVEKAPVVMDHTSALDVVRAIRQSTVHVALVFDEYGHFEGIVTSGDILEAITGAFREEGDEDEPSIVERPDGSYLVAGWMHVDDFSERLGVDIERDGKFVTVAGYVLSLTNHLPKVGEVIEAEGWHIEVIDLDGRRIDKLLFTRTQLKS